MDNETLRALQLKKLDSLHEIERICEKHNLRFFLDYGTLLGAIRHGGYIPWDDDIDLSMPISDFNKFIKIAKTELDDRFFLQTADTDPPYSLPFMKIRTNNTTDLFIPWKKYKIHQGLCLDIFQIYPLARNKILRSIQYKAAMVYKLSYKSRIFESKKIRAVQKVMHLLPRKFWAFITIPFFAKYSDEKAVTYSHLIEEPKAPILASDLFPLKKMRFEDKEYPVPANYHVYMTATYGDYMTPPPEAERIGHDGFIVDLDKSYEEYLDK